MSAELIHVSYGDRNKAAHYLRAARCPLSMPEGEFGLFTVKRQPCLTSVDRMLAGAGSMMTLFQLTEATLNKPPGFVVMEDSRRELVRHLPIWLAARGRVLVTGLGLGCVVRGLLANPKVTIIDVVEIDADIIEHVWPEFASDPRCRVHHCDALELKFFGKPWDYAWHDISTPDDLGLQGLHAKLLQKFWPVVEARQGAWDLPSAVKRRLPYRLLGAPKTSRNRRGKP